MFIISRAESQLKKFVERSSVTRHRFYSQLEIDWFRETIRETTFMNTSQVGKGACPRINDPSNEAGASPLPDLEVMCARALLHRFGT
jgi:hypothetical protein